MVLYPDLTTTVKGLLLLLMSPKLNWRLCPAGSSWRTPPHWLNIMLEGSKNAYLFVAYDVTVSLRDCLEQILSQLPRMRVLRLCTMNVPLTCYHGNLRDCLKYPNSRTYCSANPQRNPYSTPSFKKIHSDLMNLGVLTSVEPCIFQQASDFIF